MCPLSLQNWYVFNSIVVFYATRTPKCILTMDFNEHVHILNTRHFFLELPGYTHIIIQHDITIKIYVTIQKYDVTQHHHMIYCFHPNVHIKLLIAQNQHTYHVSWHHCISLPVMYYILYQGIHSKSQYNIYSSSHSCDTMLTGYHWIFYHPSIKKQCENHGLQALPYLVPHTINHPDCWIRIRNIQPLPQWLEVTKFVASDEATITIDICVLSVTSG